MPADFIVRPIDPVADGPALHAIYGDEASCHYLSRPATASIADTIAMMRGWMTRDDINWVLADNPGGPAIGRVSLYASPKPQVWEAACMISSAARGRNLAARALALAIEEAFERRGVRRIMADVDPDNIPSIRVFEKLVQLPYLRHESLQLPHRVVEHALLHLLDAGLGGRWPVGPQL